MMMRSTHFGNFSFGQWIVGILNQMKPIFGIKSGQGHSGQQVGFHVAIGCTSRVLLAVDFAQIRIGNVQLQVP